MKRKISIQGLILMVLICLAPWSIYGQPTSGHFVYGLISYVIIDSAIVSERDATTIIEYLKEEFTPELYFNKEWVVVVSEVSRGSIKWMYNRKSRILYKYYIGQYYDRQNNYAGEVKKLSFDSIQAQKRNDKALLAAIDTMKSDMQVVEYPKEKKSFHGYPCHKVTVAGFNNPPTLDEIWVAKFANVPDLIFPDEYYFLLEGIPLEITQDFQDIKIKWGVVDILPVKPDDDIFKQHNDGYEASVFDSRKLVYDGIHFIRTYEPKKD